MPFASRSVLISASCIATVVSAVLAHEFPNASEVDSCSALEHHRQEDADIQTLAPSLMQFGLVQLRKLAALDVKLRQLGNSKTPQNGPEVPLSLPGSEATTQGSEVRLFTDVDEDPSKAMPAGPKCSSNANCGWHATCSSRGHCATLSLFEMPWADAAFGLLSFLIAGISLAAGVGGGGLFVPLLMLVLSFDARTATGLSQSMLFGGAVAAFVYNLGQSHPSAPEWPLIDFELACLLAPALMAGAQLGSLVHATAPPAVLLFLLCIVLFDAARKGLASAMKIWAKENEKEEARAKRESASKHDEPFPEPAPVTSQELELTSIREKQPEIGGVMREEPAPSPGAGGSVTAAAPAAEAASEGTRVQAAQLKLFGVWLFTCAVILGKGLLLDICSTAWWIMVASSTLCLLGFALYFASGLSTREPAGAVGLDFRELAFPLVRWSLLAGMLAALCGIGGGMVMGPILVGLKVPPPVSSATTATTLLLISSSTALVYWCRGLVPQSYSVYLSLITACGAFTGKSLIGAWVRRTGRDSVIVWCLAGITILSTMLMGSLGLWKVKVLGKAAFVFASLCHED